MSPKIVIGTINVKNAMDNTMPVFVPFLSTKEIDSTQMTKTVKILAQMTSQPTWGIFCRKLHILKFNFSTQKEAKVCVLLDTGTQRSYISDELRNYLK